MTFSQFYERECGQTGHCHTASQATGCGCGRRGQNRPVLTPAPAFYRADYPLCVPRHFSNDATSRPDQSGRRSTCAETNRASTSKLQAFAWRRLQDISEKDAIAEGIEPTMPNPGHWNWRDYLVDGGQTHAVLSYKTLWESINGTGSWDAKPVGIGYCVQEAGRQHEHDRTSER